MRSHHQLHKETTWLIGLGCDNCCWFLVGFFFFSNTNFEAIVLIVAFQAASYSTGI